MHCHICNDIFKTNNKIFKFNICNHAYHYKCINKWFDKSHDCPLCLSTIESNI